jgi:hypothetical protein
MSQCSAPPHVKLVPNALPCACCCLWDVCWDYCLDMQLPMWDELWWDDGLYHSQPVLDGTLEPQLQPEVSSAQ